MSTTTKTVKPAAVKTVSTVSLIHAIVKASAKPIKAHEIATVLRFQHGYRLCRRDINSILYSELRNEVSKNSNWEWSVV